MPWDSLLLVADWPVQFASPLGLTAWAVLAGVPVGIIALYFLKLRRRPVQVPSTLLWRRSLEDLHVNSLFQRLRRNLLLFLQLLAVFLAMLALLGPRVKGTASQGQRHVIAIDNSASMSATDVAPSRLAKAKQEAKQIITNMESDDLAMVIAFSDRARVVSNYTGNRALLQQRIDTIEPTQSTTSLREALQVAAGLANPSKQIGEGVIATSVVPPKLFIFTDGGFPDVEGFSLGNLEPEVIVIGPKPPAPSEDQAKAKSARVKAKNPSDNVAIVALQAGRNEEKAGQFQVFGRVHNYRAEPVATEAKLLRYDPAKPGAPGTLIDALALMLDPQSDQSFKFDLPDTGAAELEVRLDVKDALAVDNRAFAIFGNPRKAQVLVVTSPKNRYLIDTLRTPAAEQLADVNIITPEQAKEPDTSRDLAAGRYDLVIFDRFSPAEPPQANTLYFGALPPGKAYEKAKEVEYPAVADWDTSHPLMQYIRDLALILIKKAMAVELPPGAKSLIDGEKGSLAFVVPRSGYVDAVVTFALLDDQGFNTDWPLHLSFPLYLFNVLRLLGNARESASGDIHLPDQPVVLRADSSADRVVVTAPDGSSQTVKRSPQGTFLYNGAKTTGIYHVRWGEDGSQSFAVNLFDARESDLAPRGLVPEGVPPSQADRYKIKIGYTPVQGTRRTAPAQKDWWKPIALLALGVVLLEWYIYNRRVYI
ncbi:MAG: BatA and WFA domain-containing protein [Isosphaeraceae bacterium]|nr:BatA and WFA domain-containing protein [Isosphaeraceae bacterium]